MDKSLIIFIVIGMGFMYFITSFVGDIQAEDEAYRNDDYNNERKYNKYKAIDSVGQDILDLSGADEKTQVSAWNNSILKDEFLELFPDFDAMKYFVNDRLKGDLLVLKLNTKISAIEDMFFSGTITARDAKQELGNLK